jgi:uncharacterized coiled-coil protein SlyX
MTSQRIGQVERACNELAAHGDPVTFVAIAARTSIPRVTLYRNPALRAIIDEHRAMAAQATTLTGLAAQLATQQLALHALADKVRQHEEQLRKLAQHS